MVNYWLKNFIIVLAIITLLGVAHFPDKQWFVLLDNSKMLIIFGAIVLLGYGYFHSKEDKEYSRHHQWYAKVVFLIVIVFSLIIFEANGGIPTIFSPGESLFYVLIGVGLLELFVSGQKHFNKQKKTS